MDVKGLMGIEIPLYESERWDLPLNTNWNKIAGCLTNELGGSGLFSGLAVQVTNTSVTVTPGEGMISRVPFILASERSINIPPEIATEQLFLSIDQDGLRLEKQADFGPHPSKMLLAVLVTNPVSGNVEYFDYRRWLVKERDKENLLINSDFVINQRHTTSVETDDGFVVDRWKAGLENVTPTNIIFSQEDFGTADLSDFGDDLVPEKIMKIKINNGEPSDDNHTYLHQDIEDVRKAEGQYINVNGYIKGDVGNFFTVSATQLFEATTPNSNFLLGAKVTIETATWQRFSVYIKIPTIDPIQTIDADSRLRINLSVSAGANVGQNLSGLPMQAGDFYFANVQVNVGKMSTEFSRPDPGEEMTRCERFYQVVHDGELRPMEFIGTYVIAASGQGYGQHYLRTRMRKKPAVTLNVDMNKFFAVPSMTLLEYKAATASDVGFQLRPKVSSTDATGNPIIGVRGVDAVSYIRCDSEYLT